MKVTFIILPKHQSENIYEEIIIRQHEKKRNEKKNTDEVNVEADCEETKLYLQLSGLVMFLLSSVVADIFNCFYDTDT